MRYYTHCHHMNLATNNDIYRKDLQYADKQSVKRNCLTPCLFFAFRY